MEFYKEGRVLTVAPNTTLDLGEAQYNHKAALIISEAPSPTDVINVKFYTKAPNPQQYHFLLLLILMALLLMPFLQTH